MPKRPCSIALGTVKPIEKVDRSPAGVPQVNITNRWQLDGKAFKRACLASMRKAWMHCGLNITKYPPGISRLV